MAMAQHNEGAGFYKEAALLFMSEGADLRARTDFTGAIDTYQRAWECVRRMDTRTPEEEYDSQKLEVSAAPRGRCATPRRACSGCCTPARVCGA